MKRLAWILVMALAAGAATPLLAQPSTQPGDDSPSRPGRRGQFNREEFGRAMEFAEQNMPHMHAFMMDLPRGERRARMAGFMLERYRRSVRIQRENPERYDAYLARLKVQDEPFELVRKIQEAPEEQKPALQEELRSKMRRVVQGWLEERRQRIHELERQLEREKQLLERDSQREIDRLANEHMNKLLGELRDPRLSPPELGMPPEGGPASPTTEPSESPRRQ